MDRPSGVPIEVAFWVLAAVFLAYSVLTRTSVLLALVVVVALRTLFVLEHLERSLEVAFWVLAVVLLGFSVLTHRSVLLAFVVVIAFRGLLVLDRIEQSLRDR